MKQKSMAALKSVHDVVALIKSLVRLKEMVMITRICFACLLIFNLTVQAQALANDLDIETLTARAQSGDLSAQKQLADFYRSGGGSLNDMRKAARWYQEAAMQGDAEAQFQLAVFYRRGEGGIQKDTTYASQLLYRAAKQGHLLAQINLGHSYRHGLGVKQDHEQAAFWFEKAISNSPYEWSSVYYYLGGLYVAGTGVKKNLPLAIEYFARAANEKHPPALFQLGLMHQYGEGVPVNFEKAAEYYSAVENGVYDITGEDADIIVDGGSVESAAKANLAYLYYYGRGVKEDKRKAFDLFKSAADKGNYYAQHNIGTMYGLGEGVSRDYVKSEEWLMKAARSGFSLSQVALGHFYNKGIALPRDISRSKFWFGEAAKQGNDEGARMLKQLQASSLNSHSEATRPLRNEQSNNRQKNSNNGQITASDIWGGLAVIGGLLWLNNVMTDNASNNTSEHNQKKIDKTSQCRDEVVSRTYWCNSSLGACDIVGCNYEWVCRDHRNRKGNCNIRDTYMDPKWVRSIYCDPEIGKWFESEEEVLVNSCQ